MQEEACKALYNLLCNDSNKRLIIIEGGLSHLILIMGTETVHVDVIVETLKVVYNIVAVNEHQTSFSRENGIQILMKLIIKYENLVHVLKETYKVLRRLCHNNIENKSIIACKDKVKMILKHIGCYIA